MGCYAQLTQEQRYQIRRNRNLGGYRPAQAQRLMRERRQPAVTKKTGAGDWRLGAAAR